MSMTERISTEPVIEAEKLIDLIRASARDGVISMGEISEILTQSQRVLHVATVSDLNVKHTASMLRNGPLAQHTVRTGRELRRELTLLRGGRDNMRRLDDYRSTPETA